MSTEGPKPGTFTYTGYDGQPVTVEQPAQEAPAPGKYTFDGKVLIVEKDEITQTEK